MAKHLSRIGLSEDLRRLVSTTDIAPVTISMILDAPRTLTVDNKQTVRGKLIVRCHEGTDIIILHLPFEPDSHGYAIIISDKES